MKRWYVAQAQPRREALAEQQLNNQEFETFCPMRRRMRRIGGRAHNVLDCFFPGYLFVSLDIERDRWRSVNGTIGVVRLIGFGGASDALPAPLPHGLVEGFQACCRPDREMRFDERLGDGDRVRVMGGPFDNLCGRLQSACDKQRVTILLDILSKQTRVEIERDRIIAA